MSDVLIRRLDGMRGEFEVAKASTQYLQSEWPRLHSHPAFKALAMTEVRQAVSNLEVTYIVRLFTTFASMLRDFLPRPHPNHPDRRGAYDLIDRTASRLHITTVVKEKAHQFREYRNHAVHEGETAMTAMLFADALATLNRFLSWLPNPP